MSIIPGHTTHAPPPAGPYSQSVRKGSVVAAAGQAGFTPEGVLRAGVREQTRQTLENLHHTLAASGADWGDVVSLRVYLVDVAHFEAMNEVYAQVLSEPYPARTTVYVTLPPGLLVEIDALAVVG